MIINYAINTETINTIEINAPRGDHGLLIAGTINNDTINSFDINGPSSFYSFLSDEVNPVFGTAYQNVTFQYTSIEAPVLGTVKQNVIYKSAGMVLLGTVKQRVVQE